MMRNLTSGVLLAAIVAAPLAAWAKADAKTASKLVRGSVDSALEVLKDPTLQGGEKRAARWARLREVSNQTFDWTAMARRSLGVHWRKLNDEERNRFVTTFRELLATHYLGQIDAFSGKEKVEFKGTSETPEGIEVKMQVVTASRTTVPLHFFVDERPKVFDVSIEGVSIANHYRGVFTRLLVNSDFDTLMKKLERKVRRKQKKIEQGDKKSPK